MTFTEKHDIKGMKELAEMLVEDCDTLSEFADEGKYSVAVSMLECSISKINSLYDNMKNRLNK